MKKIYKLFLLIALVCLGTFTAQAEDLTLTVMDDDWTTQSVPVDGYNLDGSGGQHNQLLFLSNELSSMNGTTIKGLKFYFNKTGYSWSNASNIPNVTFRLAEVENTSLTSQITVDESFTQVYSGAINFDFTNKEFTITFDAPYSYNGGNLLVDIQTTAGAYVRKSGNYNMAFFADDVSGRALKGTTTVSYCPKTTFTYEEAADPNACNKPKNLAISAELPDGATFTWEQNADETVYQWACVTSGAPVEAWNTLEANVRTKTVEGLAAGTAYDFYVRSYCGEGENEQSDPVKQTFTPTCPAPTLGESPVTAKTATTATIAWNAADGISKYQYICVEKNATPNWEEAKEVTTTSADVAGLEAYTEYDFYVRSWYSATSISDAVKTTFRTECAAVNAPYAWDFEDATTDATPGCWDNSASTAVPGFGSTDYNWTAYSYSSNKSLRMYNSYLKSGGISLINTPSIVLPASPAQELTFNYAHVASCGAFSVKISTDGGANFTDLDSYSNTAGTTSSYPGTFDEATISLAAYAGQTIVLQFNASPDYGYGAVFVDNVTIQNAASCAKPTGLGYSERAAHSVKLSWTSDASAWKVEYSENSDFSASTVKNATENPYVLSGLEANTHYYVRIKADCGASGESEATAAIDFTTKCEDATLPLTEDFESGALPECWSAASQWATYAYSSGHNNSTSMRFNASTTADLTLRDIYLDDDAQFSFWRQSSYVSCGIYINDGTGLTQLGENFAKSSSWKKDSVDLSSYKGKTVTLVIRGNYYSSGRYLFIDDIAVTYKPVALPTNLVATPGNASATITWESAEGTSWNFRYRIVKAEEPYNEWTTLEGLTAKSKELTGLTNGTEYEVQVQTIASANRQSAWTASATFTPQSCATVETVTFGAKTYNSVVVNWTTTGAGTWNLDFKQGDSDWVERHDLTEQTLTLNDLATGIEYTVVVYPTCNAEGAVENTFTLGYTAPVAAEAENITDAAATVQWLAVADASSYEYDFVLSGDEADWKGTSELSATASNLAAGTDYLFVVRSVYPTGHSEADTTEFSTITIAPQNLQQDGESTTTSATFTWEANGAATQYQWSIDNTNWSEPIAAITATATGLNSGSSYTFYVRSYYSETVQSAAISLPFQTECAVETLPFSQDFGTTSEAKPACWNIANWGTSANYWTTAGEFAKTGVALKYNAKTLNTADAITPSIEISDKCELKFYVRNAVGTGSAKVESKVLVDDGSTTTELASITTRYTTATLQTIDLSAYVGKTVTIIFRGVGYDSGTSSSLWIDDVTVTFKPVATPTNVVATSANEGATITWESEEGASWNLRYRVVDTEEWTNVEGLTAKSKELTGLTNGTTYEVQVQAVVSANRQSEWTDSKTFTPQACATVETVTFGARTYNSIVVNWTTSGAGTWNLDFKQGDSDWVERHDLTEQTLTLNDLATGIEYTVVVYPTCNAEGAVQNTFTLGYTAPVAAEAENITDAAATVQWLAVTDASSYEYDFVLPGDEADWKGTSELSATASNLAAGTDYLFVVRSVYPTGHSEADTTEFKTITIAPTALVKEAATTESITFSWSYAGAATQFQYKVNDGEWSAAQTALTATAEGLSAGTTYTIYVRAYYADGKYSAELSGDLSTECGTYALPYEQNFEAEGLPLCWETENWGTDANQWGRSSEYKKTGYYSIRYNANTDSYAEISLPTIHLDDIAVLTFYTRNSYYANYSYNYVSGKVIVSAAGEEPQEVAINNNSAYSLAEQTIELDSKFVDKDVTITFHAEGVGASAYLYIDDVTVIAKPCPTTSLTATAALDSVVLTWSGDATQYQYCIEEGTAEPSAWTLLDEDVFTVTVKGLTPNQAYTAYVRSYCSASKQGEAAKQAFTPACPAPTALVVDEVSTTTATLSWTAAAGISKYQYRLGTDEWSNENVVEGTSVELTSLSPATTYTLYVRSWYNADVQSTTAITKSFTTECAAIELPFNEDFSGDINCWTLESCHANTGIYGGAFRFYYSSNPPQYLISPELVPTVQNVKVQFEYKGQSTSYKEEFQLGYSLTTKEITAFAWSDTVFCQETDYQDYVQVVPAGVRYIAIRYTANNQYYLFINNFSAEETTDYPTALDNTGAEGAKATKRLENDVLIIEFNGVQYNAQGQLLKK